MQTGLGLAGTFVWPEDTGGPGRDPSLLDFSAELPGWFPLGDQSSLPLSPILSDSPEGLVVGSPAASPRESDTPSGTVAARWTFFVDSPPVELSRPTLTSSPVPRWHLTQEGPFLSERSASSLNCFGDGCFDMLFVISHIVLRTTLGRLEVLGLRCIIPGF